MKYPLSQKQKDLLDKILQHRFNFNNKKWRLSDGTRIMLVSICVDKEYKDEDRPMLTQLTEGYGKSKGKGEEVDDWFALKYLGVRAKF